MKYPPWMPIGILRVTCSMRTAKTFLWSEWHILFPQVIISLKIHTYSHIKADSSARTNAGVHPPPDSSGKAYPKIAVDTSPITAAAADKELRSDGKCQFLTETLSSSLSFLSPSSISFHVCGKSNQKNKR